VSEDKLIGLVTTTAAGRRGAQQLAAHWPNTRTYGVKQLAQAWEDCDALVCFLAIGATVRLVAPLLADKQTDPAVVCVDDAQRHAVAVLGGHAGGANELASRVAELLGGQAVITTATDATGIAALDQLGWPYEGDVAAVTRALLDGNPVSLSYVPALAEGTGWPLPALPTQLGTAGPASTTDTAGPAIVVSDLLDPQRPTPSVVLRPPSLVVGVGASRGVSAAEVLGLIRQALADAGLAEASIAQLATVDIKADEVGLIEAAAELGVPLTIHTAETLAGVEVPNPSEVVRNTVGTASVAEAAALIGGGELVVPKRKSVVGPDRTISAATVAIVRKPPRGRLAIVGIGPGDRDLLTPQARDELRRASVIVGLDQYVAQIRDLLRPGTRVLETGLGAEQERASSAATLAKQGHAVALIGSGDAGIYAMASPALEEADETFDVIGAPGVTAMLASAALLGAPLGHDHAAISLSDLHTPWGVIERRITAAAEGDFVVSFYNPRSRGRDWQLPKALALLSEHRPGTTPVGIVSDATRPTQQVTLTTLEEFDVQLVGMTSLVMVGSSQSRNVAGRFVTPRGYAWRV
jgi:cobalt-precorrin 5A hydrolase/precorrin-3B C17-methyltransferase